MDPIKSSLEFKVSRSILSVTLLYTFFVLGAITILWLGAMAGAASYIDFLVLNLKHPLKEIHWVSIFLELHHPSEALKHINFSSPTIINIPSIFGESNNYINIETLDFFTKVNDTLYSLVPTKAFYVVAGIFAIQIPIFYLIVKIVLKRILGVAKTHHTIVQKIDDNYLADKITQTIASNIHHELKTPLAALEALVIKNKSISNYIIDLINDNCSIGPEITAAGIAEKHSLTLDEDGTLKYQRAKEKLIGNYQLMDDSIMNMFNTINMIKTLKALDSSKNISVYEIIDKSIAIFKMGTNYNFTSIIDPKFKNCFLSDLDPQSLSNIIINHTRNSLEANAQIVKFEHTKFFCHNDKYFIRMHIIDDGWGMTKSGIQNAYVPKKSTKVNGTGVGLYICKTILNRVDGDERIRYTDKYGTIFELKLPVKNCTGNQRK